MVKWSDLDAVFTEVRKAIVAAKAAYPRAGNDTIKRVIEAAVDMELANPSQD